MRRWSLLAALVWQAAGACAAAPGERILVAVDEWPRAVKPLVYANALGGHWDGAWHPPEACGRRLRPGLEGPLISLTEGVVGRYRVVAVEPPSTDPPDEGTIYARGEITLDGRKPFRYPLLALLGATADPSWRVTSYSLTHKTYLALARAFLTANGVSAASAARLHLRQLLATELERDGRREVLTAFSSSAGDYILPPLERKGDFWGLTLRYVPRGSANARTRPFFLQVIRSDETVPEQTLVVGILDVNGDGTAEIVTRSAYYEGWAYQLWQWKGGKLTVVSSWGAGV
ncbi:MAG: hypothetical protein HY321_06865 [Armatimonadetes bacterium]|nr:hypothetical protein [Armatimonadota bacterium]